MRLNLLHYIESKLRCHCCMTTKYEHGTVNMGLTFSGSAYRNVVCWLSSLTLCPDVHCPVTINLEAVSDYRALFMA